MTGPVTDEPSEATTGLDAADGLDVEQFADAAALEAWLAVHGEAGHGIWVRLYRRRSAHPSVGFAELRDVGRRFGWRIGTRRSDDVESFLQRLVPRRGEPCWPGMTAAPLRGSEERRSG